MPTKESTRIAVSLGSAAMFGSMGVLVILGGILASMAVTGKEWSEEMTATVNAGASLMFTSGAVMLVLAVVCAGLGWFLSNQGRRAGR